MGFWFFDDIHLYYAPSDTPAPAAKVPILPAPTSMRLAVACEMHGKFATPRQIPIDYALTRIPFGNVRHEVLQETGEHVLYINISLKWAVGGLEEQWDLEKGVFIRGQATLAGDLPPFLHELDLLLPDTKARRSFTKIPEHLLVGAKIAREAWLLVFS